MKIAAIDIGTNSIHMIIVDLQSSLPYRVIDRENAMIRLGQGIGRNGRLTSAAMRRGVEVLSQYRKLADSHGVEKILACATSAVREASNGGDFLVRVVEQTGIQVRLVPGIEEGRLVLLAVQQQVTFSGQRALILDVGGGSVEFVLGTETEMLLCESLKLGFIRLAEGFLAHDPPTRTELRKLERYLDTRMKKTAAAIKAQGFDFAVGTSGTIQNLAAMGYLRRHGQPARNLNNYRLRLDELDSLHRDIVTSTRKQRLNMPGLQAERVDTIAAGATLVRSLMRNFSLKELLVSDASMREGIVLDYLIRSRRNLQAMEEIPDLRRRSVLKLARQCSYDAPHSQQVARLALAILEQTRPLHRLPRKYDELMEYASLLHDIGYHINTLGHHRHTYYLVKNGDLRGFAPEEVEIMAGVGRYHRRGAPRKKQSSMAGLSKEDRQATKVLTAVLQVADGLDRSHYQLIRNLRCRISAQRLILELETTKDVELEIWGARKKAAMFEQLLNRQIDLRVAAAPPSKGRTRALRRPG